MATGLAPGVYVNEVDRSYYPAAISSTRVGMIGPASKGPVNEPVLVTTPEQFIQTFGSPMVNCYEMYGALRYLQYGSYLEYVRIGSASGTDALAAASYTLLGAASAQVCKITAITPGSWANQLKVVVKNPTGTTFDLEVWEGTSFRERFVGLSVSPSSDRYFETILGTAAVGNTNFKTNPGQSRYVVANDPLPNSNATVPTAGTYTLTGGNNGLSGLSGDPSPYVGAVSGSGQRSGLEIFRSGAVDVDILAIPGASDDTIQAAMVDVLSTRLDMWGIMDPPAGLGPGTGEGGILNADAYWNTCNTSYASLYYPWVKAYSGYQNQELLLPPSGFVLGQVAYTDRVAFPWIAPAGSQRGVLQGTTGLEVHLSEGDVEAMYGVSGVNPIMQRGRGGIVIWGQRTLQATPSATDRVNVRRLLIYLKKIIRATVDQLTFEPNLARTWHQFDLSLDPALRYVKAHDGLYEYRLKMDASTVTADAIDRYEMPGRLFLKPTKAAERLALDMILTPTGASFTEVV